MTSSIKNDEASVKNDGHNWTCEPSFITDPFGSVVFYGEVTLWYANPSFFKLSLLRSVVFSVYSSAYSSYKSVCLFFKTHLSFFQNHVHEKILILTTFYGTKTIGEVLESWQCFSQCWHKRNSCNTSSFGCVILNFVNPNIVKNSTFSWLYCLWTDPTLTGFCDWYNGSRRKAKDSLERYACPPSINIIISKYFP